MSGQFCRAEARLAAPVAVRLAPQNLEMKKKDTISHCCRGVNCFYYIPNSI